MPDRRPRPDDPQWGPARTYRAKPGRNTSREAGRGMPLEDVRESDLIEPEGGYHTEYAPASGSGRGGQDSWAHEEEYQSREATYGRSSRRVVPRRRRQVRPVRWVLVLLVVALLIYPFALAQTAMMSLHRVDALSDARDTPGRTFLVVGSDTRAGTDMEEVDGQRTDTIMLLHVPSSGPTVMLSIPRDSLVEIPGHGENKINAAYAIGGAPLLVQTVEGAVGVKVDGYVETGLAGFADIVDAVGGIEVCPAFDMNDRWSNLDIKAGCQEVDGTVALAYARMRHADPRGDLGRVDRQREVMAAIASKAASPLTLLNPFSSFPLARAGGSALTVDEGFGMVQMGYFLYGMRDAATGRGLSLTVPIARTDRTTRHGQVVDWDERQAESVFTALRDSSTEAIRPIAEEQKQALGGG